MRELKFRAWSMIGDNPSMITITTGLISDLNTIENQWYVMQFTGLQDKNGVDIYEGDVVSQKLNCLWDEGRHNLEVRFNHDQFQTGNVKSYSSLYSAVQSFDAEIIGNIHQNPELLESVK
jgi:uncharacterized phage protein (TIGR01671 family)